MAKQTFDWWSLSFLLAPVLELLGYLFLDSDFGTPVALGLSFIAISSFALFVGTCVSHSYNFTDSAFTFRAGPFRKSVPLADIFEVMPTHDGVPQSTGAVRIRYYMAGIAGDSFMIIPNNQNEFLGEVARRCPHLEARGEGFKRARSTKLPAS